MKESRLSRLLAVPEIVYAAAARLHRARAERRIAAGRWPVRLPRLVVSVGNITAGGTGKTPVVEALAREWLRRGGRPAILSRGYRGGPYGNDEYQLLCRRLPGVPHVQDPDRCRGGLLVLEQHPEVDLFLLDDGFQHRPLHRDVDIVVLDATRPFGFGHLLPRGLLREPWQGLARAHHILLTRAEDASPHKLAVLLTFLRERFPRTALSVVDMVTEGLRAPDGEVVERAGDRRWAAVAGIGNPHAFFASLRRHGFGVVATRACRDHHAFSEADLVDLRAWATGAGADALISTEKDGVKLERLRGFQNGTPPVYQLRVRAEIRAPHPLDAVTLPRAAGAGGLPASSSGL